MGTEGSFHLTIGGGSVLQAGLLLSIFIAIGVFGGLFGAGYLLSRMRDE